MSDSSESQRWKEERNLCHGPPWRLGDLLLWVFLLFVCLCAYLYSLCESLCLCISVSVYGGSVFSVSMGLPLPLCVNGLPQKHLPGGAHWPGSMPHMVSYKLQKGYAWQKWVCPKAPHSERVFS